jgi:2-polyprenyl-3-methyl-5-hydroxy-6-metoxy-1,4-benzoquinol methylase
VDRQTYDEGKPHDEIYSTNNLFIRFLANRFLAQVRSALIHINARNTLGLDVGCGEGHMLDLMYRDSVIDKIVAVDIDGERIAYAKKTYPFYSYVISDAYRLCFTENTFDYVIATEIIEHLKNPSWIMRELIRVTKPHAYFIVSVPHEPFFQIGNFIRGKHLKRLGKTPTHVHFWKRHEIRRLLADYFEVELEYASATFPWLIFAGKKY